MKKKKLALWVVAIASVTITIIVAYYYIGGKEPQQSEHYWWQHDPGIVKVSERFKSIDQRNTDRMTEAALLFPIIKIGASRREIESLLGKPLFIQDHSDDSGIINLLYFIYRGGAHQLVIKISKQGVVVDIIAG